MEPVSGTAECFLTKYECRLALLVPHPLAFSMVNLDSLLERWVPPATGEDSAGKDLAFCPCLQSSAALVPQLGRQVGVH